MREDERATAAAEERGARLPPYAEAVLEVVPAVPPGHVLTYGDVAELVGWGAARSVGAVLSRYGAGLPWWRVVRADGTLPAALLDRARARWAEEGTPVRADAGGVAGVHLARARWEGPGPA